MLGFKTSSLVLSASASSATWSEYLVASRLEKKIGAEVRVAGDLYALPQERWMDYQRLVEWMNDWSAFSPLAQKPADY